MPATGDAPKAESFLFLGASRGLGHEVLGMTAKLFPEAQFRNISRQSRPGFDFSKPEIWPSLISEIFQSEVTRLWFFAGGGPYGEYGRKEWKDHQWAFRVNFECPAFLLHEILRSTPSQLKQVIFVGSSIAEDKPDPLAASYSAAKHALRGLVTSVQAEMQSELATSIDLRLFSPTYMDSALLPKSAKPRQTAGVVRNLPEVGDEFIAWALDPNAAHLNLSHAQVRDAEL